MMLQHKINKLHLNLATVTVLLPILCKISYVLCGGIDLDRYIGYIMLLLWLRGKLQGSYELKFTLL